VIVGTPLRVCFEIRVEQASRLFASRIAAEKQARRLFNCAVSPIRNHAFRPKGWTLVAGKKLPALKTCVICSK
jgi:hypothetical protein